MQNKVGGPKSRRNPEKHPYTDGKVWKPEIIIKEQRDNKNWHPGDSEINTTLPKKLL